MSFTRPCMLGPVFFRTTLPCPVAITWRGVECHYMMCLRKTVIKVCNYWKSRRRCDVYGLRGVCCWLCVIWRDKTPILGRGRKSWYIINMGKLKTELWLYKLFLQFWKVLVKVDSVFITSWVTWVWRDTNEMTRHCSQLYCVISCVIPTRNFHSL